MRSNSGKPLGIYVHIPFCKSKCEYCDFYSLGGSRDRRTTDQYLQALADHIRETGRLAPDYTVDTVYFGGGTPSFFGAENLEKILDELQKRFHFGADPEITLEANPDSVTPQGLKRLVRAGFNRISIGVQSDQDDMLKRLGRPHTYEQARMAVVRAREAGFANLSLDLMFGLPNQTLTGWRDTLENVLRLKPEHMSCYALKVEPNTPLWEYRDCANLPNDDVQADMYLAASEILQDHGYEHYEISNFCRSDMYSRHNTSYWKGIPYLGCGPSAHSFNVASLEKYIHAIENNQRLFEQEHLDRTTCYNECIMTSIRTRWGVPLNDIEQKFGKELWQYCFDMARPHLDCGNLEIYDNNRLCLSRKGIFVSDGIISDLMFVES